MVRQIFALNRAESLPDHSANASLALVPMDLYSQLDEIALRKRRREALLAAVRAGRVPGVDPANAHFEQASATTHSAPSHASCDGPVTEAIGGCAVETHGDGRCIVRRIELQFEFGASSHYQECRVPMRPAHGLDDSSRLSIFAKDAEAGIDATRIAFLDTETTGLAGGTGTLAFLVGVGWFERDAEGRLARFIVEQLLLEDYCHEPAMIAALLRRLEGFDAFCTYNGRSFDVPLLRTRCVMNRVRPALWRRPNLDLLPFARRLWRGTLPSCSLRSVEANVLGIAREHDIDSALIPAAWQDFARTGRAGVMPLVLSHNAQDIASLASLLSFQSLAFHEPETCGLLSRAGEFRGLSRWFERKGDPSRACRLAERAFECDDARDKEEEHLLALARLYRRAQEHDRAVETWSSLQQRPLAVALPAWVEHARHLEHRARDPRAARLLVHRCLRQWDLENELRMMLGREPLDARCESAVADLRRRLARLDRKVERASCTKSPKHPPAKQ